jgi:hypothetical protein
VTGAGIRLDRATTMPPRLDTCEAHDARQAAGLDGDTIMATTGSTEGSAA